MKKCLSICKIRCFVKVARWRKNTSSYAQIRCFLTEISWKITQKSMKRVGKHASSTKIYKNTACGVIFLGWNWFWVNFCWPEGAQKSCKIYEEFLAKRSWQPSGSNFACFSVFFWILASFWVRSGLLQNQFWVNFWILILFWVRSGPLQLCVFQRFFLDFWLRFGFALGFSKTSSISTSQTRMLWNWWC